MSKLLSDAELISSALSYLQVVGLEAPASPASEACREFASRLIRIPHQPAATPRSDAELLALYRYPVPKLGPMGTCSSIEGELEPEPFDLRAGTRLATVALSALAMETETVRLSRLGAIVDLLAAATASDWTGIYRRVSLSGEADVLRKEAYRGRPSRALFPLTDEFAALSNNSTAARSGRAILVRDVDAHIEAGHPYYSCDTAVQSELCIPVVEGGESIGLIDLEAFRKNAYSGEAPLIAAMACVVMVDAGLLKAGISVRSETLGS